MSEENQQFAIQKIYLKDVSFESPNSPQAFTDGEWKPQVNVQINSMNQAIAQDTYEVVLNITVTATQNDKMLFLLRLNKREFLRLLAFQTKILRV